jgi:hypothetical protein
MGLGESSAAFGDPTIPTGAGWAGRISETGHPAPLAGVGGLRFAGPMSRTRCSVIPPYLLRRLAEVEAAAAQTLVTDERIRSARAAGPRPPMLVAAPSAWTIHTADNTQELPGRVVRTAADGETGDAAVDEAAAGITASLALLSEVFGRSSYDDRGAEVSATVHYGRDYVNAFWDGTQLVFGDGDNRVFERFTKAVDVLGHELAHAVTEHSAGLAYSDQPGALNESMSDVFASCLKQRLLGQDVTEADWLIGAELFRPTVQARALRDLAAPGTAYDDPQLGRDPQVGHLDDYVETDDDNGGVHLNSGIPNRAFHLASIAIGGRSWEGAGPIWMAALTGDAVRPDSDFAAFARATVAAAGDHADVVRDAWREVGVRPGSGVRVRRTGGFVGRTVEAAVELDSDDERAGELRDLVGRVGPQPVKGSKPHPDGFTYEFDLDGETRRVFERDLTPDLRRIADLVLRQGDA